AEDGLAVEPGIREHPADVLLLDVSMPKKNGFEVARSLSRDHPDLRIVFLTMHKNEKMLSEAFESGGRGYVLKENAFEELAAAIRTVNGGQIYVSPELASLMLPGFLEKQREGEDLSDRELEVLKLLAEGCSNKEIADQLHISVKTVETHRANIMRKHDFKNVTELVLYAVRNHIIEV
ncbi:MAG: response regulator transcription factor, partial [Clostridiales bacterium]|nr:response regulator transcription factor [Clostridiales bacterium]